MECLRILTHSAAETQRLAGALASCLREGDFLALEGDLGAGKTCFVQGLARGLGAPETVTSPTFNLIHEYRGGRLALYHFDVYRLSRAEELEGLGYEEYFYGDGVCAVEWSELIAPYLPKDRLTLRLTRLAEGMAKIPPGAEDRVAGDGAAVPITAGQPEERKAGAAGGREPVRQAEFFATGPESAALLTKLAKRWQEMQK